MGIASWVKKARSTWRITSVAITRLIPSRPASMVASVDLPTPVVPPIRTTSGRSSRPSRVQARKRRTAVSPSSAWQHLLADRVQALHVQLARRRARRAAARPRAPARTSARARARWPTGSAPSGPSSRAARGPCGRRSSRRHRAQAAPSPGAAVVDADGAVAQEDHAGALCPRPPGDRVDRGRLQLGEVDVTALRGGPCRGPRPSAPRASEVGGGRPPDPRPRSAPRPW